MDTGGSSSAPPVHIFLSGVYTIPRLWCCGCYWVWLQKWYESTIDTNGSSPAATCAEVNTVLVLQNIIVPRKLFLDDG